MKYQSPSKSQLKGAHLHQRVLHVLSPINRNRSLSQHLHCFGEIFHKIHLFLLSAHTYTHSKMSLATL